MNKGYAFISLQLFGLHRLAVTLLLLQLALAPEAKASTLFYEASMPFNEASTPFNEAHPSSIDASMSIDASRMFIEEPSKPAINVKKDRKSVV